MLNKCRFRGPKQADLNSFRFGREWPRSAKKGGGPTADCRAMHLRNIFGVAWERRAHRRAAISPEGGRSFNVSSTILQPHALYYARAAYVVPKAAMNAWRPRAFNWNSGRGAIRVNLVYPGPRSRASAFVRSLQRWIRRAGTRRVTTATQFFDMMSLERATGGNAKAKTFPTPTDIATTCVFLGSDESAAYNGQ